MHDVLDPDDRVAFGVQVADGHDQLLDFGFGEPAGDLVEQEHGRIAGERSRELEALAVQQCQFAGLLVGLVGQTRQLQRFDTPLVAGPFAQAAAVRRADQHVLEDAHVGERLGNLERAPDPFATAPLPRQVRDVVALVDDPTAIGPIHAGDHVEQCGLAGAVRPDDPQCFAVVQPDAQVVDDLDAAERLLEALRLKDDGRRRGVCRCGGLPRRILGWVGHAAACLSTSSARACRSAGW